MKFGNLFEKTISSVKKAGLAFWIMCAAVALCGVNTEVLNMDLNFTYDDSSVSSYSEIDDYYIEEELEEYLNEYVDSEGYDNLILNDILYELDFESILGDNYTEDELEEYLNEYINSEGYDKQLLNDILDELDYEYVLDELEYEYIFDELENEDILDDLRSNFFKFFGGALLVLIPLVVIAVLVMIIGINIISAILNYYFMSFAVETVDECEISKGKNLGKIIAAQILFSIIIFVPVSIFILLLIIGICTNNIILILPGMLILLVGILYLSMRYAAIYYVAVKYQDLTAKEILKKSTEITKNNILKMILYNILNGFIFGFVVALPLTFASMFLISMMPVVGMLVYFVLSLVLNTISTAFMILFNVNMYKELESNVESEN